MWKGVSSRINQGRSTDMVAEVIETDVLVVGGGGAGFQAAISAREKDARVLLVNKGTLGKSGVTHMAGVW